jgi:hypothetical protein
MSSKNAEHWEAEYQKAKYEYDTLQAKYGDNDPDVEAAYCDMQNAYNDLMEAENAEKQDNQSSSSSSSNQSSAYDDDYDEGIWTDDIDGAFDYTCDNQENDPNGTTYLVEDWEKELYAEPESDDLFCDGETFCTVRVPCGPESTITIPSSGETESPSGQRLLSSKQVSNAVSFNTDFRRALSVTKI